MQDLNIKNVILLFRFMLSFQINRFEVLKSNEKRIVALVGWGDDGTPHYDRNEEEQEIEWDVQIFENIDDALTISEYLFDKGLLRNDKISIERDLLYKRIGWDRNRFDLAINTLLDIKVDMLDEGRKSDYFFLHF